MITLIGLITKQSILIVQFANVIQKEEGLDRRAATEKASSIRLRPILMTTAAMVFGVVSRSYMGLVIGTSLIIGALISLYVVPVIYIYVATATSLLPCAMRRRGQLVAQADLGGRVLSLKGDMVHMSSMLR